MRQLKIQIEAYQKIRSSVKQVKYESRFIKSSFSEKDVAKVVEKVKKCFTCGDEIVQRETTNISDGMAAKQKQNTHFVQVKDKTKPSVFTSSGLDLKYIVCGKVIFKRLLDTGANLCLLRRSIYLKIEKGNLTGPEKCFTGIGES